LSIVVIGAGLAGLAAASELRRLGRDVIVLEASGGWGGHARSEVRQGFVFDEGPHVSFTADPRVRDLFGSACTVVEQPLRLMNVFGAHRLPHPVQCHLHGLPADLVAACILDLIAARQNEMPACDYEQWSVAAFGRAFTDTFTRRYTRKYWTVEASALSTDWIGQRVYRPALTDVVGGALGCRAANHHHYITTVRYPEAGGFQSFARGLLQPEVIRYNAAVVGVNPRTRTLTLADGGQVGYDALISSMPLPEFVQCVAATCPVPDDVRIAAESLICSSLCLVDIALACAPSVTEHIIYVYDEDIAASRISVPSALADANAPQGCGSLQAEIYFSPRKPLPATPETLVEATVADLKRMGLIASTQDVLWARHRIVRYANVVFTHARAAALETLQPWCASLPVKLAGRYGEWGYHWTDDAVRSGWAAAQAVVQTIGR
jgi:protoporphyrinogen oxidase